MDYNFGEIEKKWQQYWSSHKTFKAETDESRPKYYVLDMFPYPSGAGLHVGHPLGYIASDIFARYKRLKGFNVLHPMGYDAFGLPAEQYAIQTGQHPAVTTENNIARYREQLDKMGFSFDWDREVRTSDPKYYKWTQWTFIKLFQSWYNKKTDKAEPMADLVTEFESNGSSGVQAACSPFAAFDALTWNAFSDKEKQDMLMNFRLAYFADSIVNWCPALGCVLANDEVSDGFSVRGGHPVVRKTMKQWLLRITAYADRLLDGLDDIEWPDSIREIQRNWIGRSEGAMIKFPVRGHGDMFIEVFTTRPDTIFGVTYLTLAPEHEFIHILTTPDRKTAIDRYIAETKNRSERERIADVKRITGEFTGAFAVNPFTQEEVPIWVGDYVLAGYGTGAVMAVPAHDSRDWAFANHFGLPLKEVIAGGDIAKEAFESKEGICINSGFINGLNALKGAKAVIDKAEETGIGYRKINYRLRDAIFSRQRYWGEPFPVYYRDGIPCVLDESELPLELPAVDAYLPTVTGEPPLARAINWKTKEGYPLETNTMPGFAGSSAYYLRYMDPHNEREYFSKEANRYWENVDLYIGGAEHATGHLMYSRFWNKFLFDLGLASKEEPFKKLINQGMIQGRSSYVYRIKGTNRFVSLNLKNNYETDSLLVEISMVNNDILDINEFKTWRPDLADAEFILEDGKYVCGSEVEKMSKSKYNIVSPDDLIEKYGADTLRLYEMFLGPLEQHKPWDTKGIEGVFRFIRKLWRLYHDQTNNFMVSDEQPTKEELKVLHKAIKRVQEDIERFSFNTAVSTFMICVNDLSDLKCNKRAILGNLAIILSPYAPHISEELWCLLGNKESISKAAFPEFNPEYIVENTCTYAVSFNGKMRFTLEIPVDMPVSDIEKTALEHKDADKWLSGKSPRKVIVVPGKIINIVF